MKKNSKAVLVIIFATLGVIFWIAGDGGDYNGSYVFWGWVFIIIAGYFLFKKSESKNVALNNASFEHNIAKNGVDENTNKKVLVGGDLFERNKDIIDYNLDRLYLGSHHYYLDNEIKTLFRGDCKKRN